MSLRRQAALLLAAAVTFGCAPEVKQDAPFPEFVYAALVTSGPAPALTVPNDLALTSVSGTIDSPQEEFLRQFVLAGGFPRDQETTITIPFRRVTRDGSGNYVPAAPPAIDLATVTPANVKVLKVDGGAVAEIAYEVAGYSPATGVLTLRKPAAADGSRRWAPGRYVIAIRGGANGVKTTGGVQVSAEGAIDLVRPNVNLGIRENQPPAGLPTDPAARQAAILQLEFLRNAYWNPVVWQAAGGTWAPRAALPAEGVTAAFPAAAQAGIPVSEVAGITTFAIDGSTTFVTDAAAGQVPLPSDLLLTPDGSRVQNIPAFGAAAQGLATLDGFSTTGILLSQVIAPIQASTVTRNTVLVFDLGPTAAPTAPVWLHDVASALAAGTPSAARYLSQPPQLNQTVNGTAVSTAIGLQPAVPVPTPAGVLNLPPLREASRYLVVVTDGVRDLQNRPLQPSTIGKLVYRLAANATVDGTVTGASAIGSLPDATARQIQGLRNQWRGVVSAALALNNTGLTLDNVAFAYTVKTQTVTATSSQLSAAPYSIEAAQAAAVFTPATAAPFDTTTVGIPAAAFPNVAQFLQGATVTIDAIDPATGALNPDQTKWAGGPIPYLVAVPTAAAVAAQPNCPAPANALKCVPVVLYHHGLGGSRLQMLTVADRLAAEGFVVAAIDAPYHGDRAFCARDSDCANPDGSDGVCTPDDEKATQGDAVPPGTCTTGTLRRTPNLSTQASGNYFISANFFRIRDGFRQGLIDWSGFALSVARPPVGLPQPPANPLATALAGAGIAIDATKVYYAGLSLGGIAGVPIAATNARISRATFSVPGATLVDVFTTAPAFAQQVDAIFLSLGIDRSQIATNPAVAANYLRTLLVAKWILDPADPLNYAPAVRAKIVPASLAAALGPLAFASTDAYGQLSKCDQVVPEAFGAALLSQAGLPFTLYTSGTAANGCVPHGILGDTFSAAPAGGPVRDAVAEFLSTLATPPAAVQLP